MSLSPSSLAQLQKVILAAIEEQEVYIVKDPSAIHIMDNQKPIPKMESIVDNSIKDSMMTFFSFKKR